MWAFCRLLLLVFGILVVSFHMSIRQGEFAAPIAVTLEGFRDEDVAAARLWAAYVVDTNELVPPSQTGYWKCPPRCTVQVFLQFPEPPQARDGVVRIEIGDKFFALPLGELESAGATYWPADNVVLRDPPWFAMCRNWPGMQTFAVYYLKRSAPGLATVIFLALTVVIGMRDPFRSRFQSIFGWGQTLPRVTTAVVSSERGWNLAGWIGLIGGFIGLQFLEPYYFTQDDALAGELPGILLGCRSLWEGTFPDWNPYVFMGAPLATIGFWAITYPPQLTSYAIARHVLGNEFALLEVYAALHLLVGFLAMRHLCRRIGMGAFPRNLAALSFVYAGCILIMGRSWQPFIANAVWLPLLGIAIQRFREGPVSWSWIVGIGLVLGLSYHAGFPQIVAILGMFLVLGLAAVAVAEQIPLRRLAAMVPALLLGVGLSAPLLLHHLQITSGHERFAPVETGVYDELHAALLPYPFAHAELPTHWGSSDAEKMGHFYFFGGLFAALFALQAFCFWIVFPDRRAWGRAWWVPCGIFALLMVLGEPAYLWQGVSTLPMSKFFLRYTFRFYPWLAFCAILSGGLILERILATFRRRQPWELLLGLLMLCVLAYHLAMCTASFYSYGFRPYPPLPHEFEAIFHPYEDKSFVGDKNSRRLASWFPLRSTSPDYYLALPLNLPHYYRVPSIFGYDPVVEGQRPVAEVYRRLQDEPLNACKAYGVGWHLFSYSNSGVRKSDEPYRGMEHVIHFEPAYRALQKADLTTLAQARGTSLKELPGVDPLAFARGQSERALPMHLHCRGANIDVSGLAPGTNVTINFLWYPQMRLALDGHSLNVDKDDWQRITTTLPKSGCTLSLRYEPPWQKTCAVGAGLCACALLLGCVTLRFRES
jgi:hypothetical protein